MLDEIYLLYVSNTYHMNFECVWVHLYLLEGHVGVSMFIILISEHPGI